MLKVQHMPLSVGRVLKMEEQLTLWPFHRHSLIIDISSRSVEVMFITSKHGSWEYHRISNKSS